jgi:hypothetical protein
MELLPGGMAQEMTVTRANELLNQVVDQDQVTQHRVEVAREFFADVAHYEAQMKASMKRLRAAVAASGTSLTDIRGVGVVTAALIIGHTGDVSRFASAGHFASYNATAPIEASSGEHRRHRLNLRGNRQLNYAIHIAAITQLRYPCAGREYYDRRCAEGKNSNYPALGVGSSRSAGGPVVVDALEVAFEAGDHSVVAGGLAGPASVVGVVAEGVDVGELGLDCGLELGRCHEVRAGLADVGVGAGFGDEFARAVAVGDTGLEHLGREPCDAVRDGGLAGWGDRDPAGDSSGRLVVCGLEGRAESSAPGSTCRR